MKIKMNTTAAGPDGVLSAGQQYTVPDGLGAALCSGGYATQIAEPKRAAVSAPEPVDETADAEPVIERAVTRGRRGR